MRYLSEATILTFRCLFEKQIFIRLVDNQTAFFCTVKWRRFSRIRRVGVSVPGSDLAPQVTECRPTPHEEAPMLRRIRLECIRLFRRVTLSNRDTFKREIIRRARQ